jgi:hypothetical protein
MKKTISFLFILFTGMITLNAQSVGIGTTTPNTSAQLDINSNSKGMLVPRLTTAQRDAISNPAEGLLLYCTSDSLFYVYRTAWKKINFRLPYRDTAQAQYLFHIINNGLNGAGTAITGESRNNSIGVYGVTGNAIPNNFGSSIGVYGDNQSGGATGFGVYGRHSGTGVGVFGEADGGIGGNFSSDYLALQANGPTILRDNVSINSLGIFGQPSAILDISSNTQGVLFPRMTITQKNAILNPVNGLLIYQSGPDSIGFHYYESGRWNWLPSSLNIDTLTWRTKGNTGTNTATHFIGTKDNRPLVFKINNSRAGIIDTSGTLAFGRGALFNNPGSKKNTAYGDSALFNNGTGSASVFLSINNTAVGDKALFNNSSGAQNTGMGAFAMHNNTTGTDNTAIGYKALENVTSTFNTALGSQAANKTTVGIYTTAVGYNAGYLNTTGSALTGLGYQAGYQNTTGNLNTALGFSAGFGSGNLTNATAIGANAFVNTSNSMVLGNNAKVGIGISSPVATLHVKKILNTDSGIVFQGTENATVFFTDNVTENLLLQPGKNGSIVIINPTPGGEINIGGNGQNNKTEVYGSMYANVQGGTLSGFNMVPLGIIDYRAYEEDDYLTSGASGTFSNKMGNLAISITPYGGSNIVAADNLGCHIYLNPATVAQYTDIVLSGTNNFSATTVTNAYLSANTMEYEPANSFHAARIRVSIAVDDFPNFGICDISGRIIVYGIR